MVSIYSDAPLCATNDCLYKDYVYCMADFNNITPNIDAKTNECSKYKQYKLNPVKM